MKTASFPCVRFWSFRRFGRSGKFVLVLAGTSLLAVGPLLAQNTELDVASEPMTQQPAGGPPNLATNTTYTNGVAPGATSDVTFNAANFYSEQEPTGYTPALGVFVSSGAAPNLSIGTLDDLSTSQAITITNGSAGATGEITLNGGTDSVGGSAAGDLLYVATGATLNISNIKPANAVVGNTVSINLATSGNFDVAGTATISVPIASGFLGTNNGGGTLSANPNGITKTGVGMLTFSNAVANNYTGGTFVTAGTLATTGTANLGTGNVTLSGTGVLTLGSSASLASSAILRFAGTNTINLNNTMTDTLSTIIDTDKSAVVLAPATYTATQLDAAFGVNSFAGSGSLTVTTAVPEPSTWVGALILAVLFGVAARRRLHGVVG